MAPAHAPITNAELQLGRLIWDDVMATDKVALGRTGKWNWLTFDELMSLPQENPEGRGAAVKGLGLVRRSAEDETKPKKLPKIRPRLFVDEDLVWRTLTGHSEDFRRVPMMEWRLLVMIASTQEEGIIQGDLGRATNQDKRSVPRRTDFLSQKGYISKRTHMVRGSKTSKLWLAQFAPQLPAPSSNALNRAKGLLTKDMEPVPWYHQWVNNKSKTGREEIHYQNLCQTIVAIIKAWGTLRIRDLKRKLGISGLKWQMKIMSKFLRRFDQQGCMSYAAAKFPGNSFVFKDCVKFIRDPTEQDWKDLLATGKKIKVGSGRGKKSRGKGSKAKGKVKGRGRGRAPAFPKPIVRVLKKRRRNPPRPTVSLWGPDKPMANTIADFVLTGGEEGYTMPEISDAIVTRQFRRYLNTHLNQTCVPDLQPAGLQEHQMSSELTKIGKGAKKAQTRTFLYASARKSDTAQDSPEKSAIDPALSRNESEGQASGDHFGFTSVDNSAFKQGKSSLTSLCATKPAKPVRPKRPYRRRQMKGLVDDPPQDPEKVDNVENAVESSKPAVHTPAVRKPAVRKRGRPKKVVEPPAEDQTVDVAATAAAPVVRPTRKRKAAQRVSYLDAVEGNTEDADTEDADTDAERLSTGVRRAADKVHCIELPEAFEDQPSEDSEKDEDRSEPGVYVGIPGSLNPDVRRKGRPRKSIVLIFRSDKIKDPNYLPGWADYPKPRSEVQPKPVQKPLSIPSRQTTTYTEQSISSRQTVQQQRGDRSLTQAPESSHSKGAHQPQPGDAAPQAEDGTIVVQNLSTMNGDQKAKGQSYKGAIPVQAVQQPLSPTATNTQPPKGGVDCPKCGFRFAGSNGLLYHLTKGKNLCNSIYAENPELMARKRRNRSGRDPSSDDDDAEPQGTNSSVGSSQSSSSESLPPAPRPQAKKKPMAPKKKAAPLRRIDPNDPNDPANQRPRVVLKQRSDLKSKRLGVGGLGIKPRGVEASEAAAKEAAAAKFIEVPADTTTAAAGSTFVDVQDGAASAEEDEEDLPYIDFIRPKAAKPTRFSKSKATSRSKSPEEIDRSLNKDSPAHGAAQGHPASADPYPAEVLDPTKRTTTAERSTSLTKSLSTPSKTRARKSLPGKRPERPEPPTRSADGTVSSFHMDAEASAAHDGRIEENSKALRTNRICQIIKYLVTNSGGVFPSDRALHWGVLKIYMATFPGLDYPTLAGCSRAVSILARDGIAKTLTVAVRANGLWKSLRLVTLADMDPNDPAVNSFKDKAKEAEVPEMYIPPPFNPTENEKTRIQELEKPTKQRGKGLGRRDDKLAEGISQLTAPYYAKTGMAGVRPRYRTGRRGADSSGEDDGPPTKRRRTYNANGDVIHRRKRKGDENSDWPPAKRRGRKSAADDYAIFIVEPHKLSIDGSHAANPGISSLPASFFSTTTVPNPVGYSASTAIQFLVPNTHLDDDLAPKLKSSSQLEPEHEPEPEPEAEPEPEPEPDQDLEIEIISPREEQDPEPFVRPGTHADTIELQAVEGSKGVWPKHPLSWWEKKGGSFAMKGWMPGNTEQLMENIPKTMEQMALKFTSHCKTEQWADPNYGVFCTSVDGCRSYELSEAGKRALSGTVGANYLWINLTAVPAVSNMAPIDPQWLDENEWTLETIPYEMLESDDEDLDLKLDAMPQQPVGPKRRPGRPRTKEKENRPVRKYVRKKDRDPNLRELKLQRELTPYPREPSDYFRVKGKDCLGVDWKAEDTRIAAYVAVSTLMGGINKAMDWGLMMRIFPESKLSNLRKFWSMIRKERDGFINTLTSKFQEDFLEAYEKGELPPFDFEKPLEYDWPLLVKWTLALVVREGIELPPTRKQFDEELELVHVDKNDFDWRETYHHWQRSVFNKFQDSTSEPAATVLDLKQVTEANDMIIARSWVRALCCTEPHQYTPYKIRDKFLELARGGQRSEQEVSDLLEATIFDLEHRRIAIKQKSSALATGRPYKLNEHFCRTLDRYSNEDKFTVAAEFKLKLDEAFKKGETVEIPWRTEDGMVLAAFNLQAAGRVHIEPVPSRKLDIPFGFKPGFYESRKFPKSYYRFDLHIVPTPAYLHNEQIDVLRRATSADNIPAATEDGKLPMWCDFFGRTDRQRWFKMLAGVMFTLSTRGAMTDEFTAQALKPCFEQFEIEIVRKWGLKEGLLREVTVPGGAVTVTEWWWLVLGSSMLELAVGGAKEGEQTGVGSGRRSKDQYAEWASGRSRRRGKYRVIH